MADGTTYSITVDAEAIGADATAEDINGVADALEAAERVATPFDAAIAAAESQLAKAADAAADAAGDLKLAGERMAGLERASVRAGKAVEKQAKLGAKGMGDVAVFRASKVAADEAAQAVLKQAAAVGKARTAAMGAARAEQKLAGSLGTLQRAGKAAVASMAAQAVQTNKAAAASGAAAAAALKQAAAVDKAAAAAKKAAAAAKVRAAATKKTAAAVKSGSRETVKASDAAGMLGGRLGSLIPRMENAANLFKGMGGIGLAAIILVAAAAFVALNVAIMAASYSALKFAIANDKIAKARLDKIAERTSKAWKALFSGLKTEPLLNAMDRFSSQFTQSTASGQALKSLMETIVQPFANAVEAVEPIAREMFKGAVLGALKLAIVVLKVRNAILRAIPPEARAAIKEFASGADAMSAAVGAGEVVIYALTAVVAALGWIFTAVSLAIAVAWAVIYAPIALVIGAVKFLVRAFQTGGKSITDAVKKLGGKVGAVLSGIVSVAKTIGGLFSSGLAAGIEGGGSVVSSAASRVADQAVAAANAKLETGSPSKAMARAGGFAAEGLASGMDKGTGKVRTAAERMTSTVTDQVGSAGAASNTTVEGGTSSTRGGNTYHVVVQAPTGDGEDIKDVLDAWFKSTLDAEAITLGVGPEPEAAA